MAEEKKDSLFDEVPLFDQLEQNGVDLSDPNAVKAIEITAKFYIRALDKSLQDGSEYLRVGQRGADVAEALHGKLQKHMRWTLIQSGVAAGAGLLAGAVTVLPTDILQRISYFVHRFFAMFAIHEASAEPSSGGVIDMPHLNVRTAVYGLLIVSHLISMVAWLWGPEKSRKTAHDYVKTLTHFFIGAATGKVI